MQVKSISPFFVPTLHFPLFQPPKKKMMRRCTALVPRRALAQQALVPVRSSQNRALMAEVFNCYWLPSMSFIWFWSVMTWLPMWCQDSWQSTFSANKVTVLNWMYEKHIDSKLRMALDDCITEWDDNLEASQLDAAVARTF